MGKKFRPLPREEYQSFEAYHLVPIRHGMTIGELLLMINEIGWAKDLKRVDLKIVQWQIGKENNIWMTYSFHGKN